MGDGASLEVGLTTGESKPKGNPSCSQWGGLGRPLLEGFE